MKGQFYSCFNIETGLVEALFRNDGDALDFKAMYPQVVSEPKACELTYDMIFIIIESDKKGDIPGVQYVKPSKDFDEFSKAYKKDHAK